MITALKMTIKRMSEEQVRSDAEKLESKDKAKYWKSRCEAIE